MVDKLAVDDEADQAAPPSKRKKEFDCPECSANNPYDEGIGDGDEIRCYYCGLEFKVTVGDDGRFKYRGI